MPHPAACDCYFCRTEEEMSGRLAVRDDLIRAVNALASPGRGDAAGAEGGAGGITP